MMQGVQEPCQFQPCLQSLSLFHFPYPPPEREREEGGRVCVCVCERERERERFWGKIINSFGYVTVCYLGNEAGHLVAVKLVRIFTVNINHSHVSLTLRKTVVSSRKKILMWRFYQKSSVRVPFPRLLK